MATTQTPGAERGHQESVNIVLNSSKPLHRFVQGETRSLAIVILIFGCTEILMGFQLSNVAFYIPFWQGALYIIDNVYADTRPQEASCYSEIPPAAVDVYGELPPASVDAALDANYDNFLAFQQRDLDEVFGL
ncbi:unnamed protein product [Merluccius merluccius]